MKLLSSVFILILGIVHHAVTRGDPNTEGVLKKFLLTRCEKRHSLQADAAYNSFNDHLDEFLSYFQVATNDLPDGALIFCKKHQHELEEAMRNLVNDMIPCLPEEEQYLPSYFFTSFSEFMEFLCHDNEKNIKFFFSPQAAECRDSLKKHNVSLEIDNCFAKMFGPLNNTVHRDILCADLDAVRRCFALIVRKHCEKSNAFKSLVSNFFDAISKPCSGVVFVSSILLVITGIVVSKFVF